MAPISHPETGIISEQDRRALRTACCCLNSLRIRVEARANVTERAVISRQLQLMQASVQPHPTEDLNTADTSCPSRTSAEHFDDSTGPCRRIEGSQACTNAVELATMQLHIDCLRTAPRREISVPKLICTLHQSCVPPMIRCLEKNY